MTTARAATRALFDARAAGYGHAGGMHAWLAAAAAAALGAAGDASASAAPRNGRLLDVAAGTGLVARAAGAGGGAVLLDLSPGMLRRAAPGPACVVGDAHALPFLAASFAWVSCVAADR